MVSLPRFLGPLSFLFAGVSAARVARKAPGTPGTKFIAGVPVLHYDQAYDGMGSLSEVETAREQEWVVMVKKGTSEAAMKAMCRSSAHGCKMVGKGVPFLEFRGTEADLDAVIRSGQGAVKFVEPDFNLHTIPELSVQDVDEPRTWGLNRIGATERTRTGLGTYVFILDTGVRTTHIDFTDRAINVLDGAHSSGPRKCADVNGPCAVDGHGHGTHCAGSAAGDTLGVAPSAAIRGIKVCTDQGRCPNSATLAGINFVIVSEESPAVASMSLGGPGSDPASTEAVNTATEAGVVVVVAGGNDNSDACFFTPAGIPSAITVGSSDSTDKRSSFSNYGSCIDIWAPGSEIDSAAHNSDSGLKRMSGTSMACPHVSGAAALVLGESPSNNSSEVLKALLQDAWKNVLTDLRLNDTNSLLYIGAGGAPPSPTVEPTLEPPAPTCTGFCRGGGLGCLFGLCDATCC